MAGTNILLPVKNLLRVWISMKITPDTA